VYDDHVVHVLNMTSQTWMDDSFSDRSIWWHYVVVVRPTGSFQVINDQSGIFVGLGEMDDAPPDPETDPFIPLLVDLSLSIGGVSAMVTNIPQQPCVFNDDPAQMSRREDAIIAWTWAHFMNDTANRDTDVLLYYPMVKSIVRAMDAITAFTTEQDPFWAIDKYIITGPSKRGWTTWLTGAADPRVVGIAPMVLTMLNIIPNLHHHYQSMGGWSWAFGDYHREGLTKRLDSEDAALLGQMQDPYELREYLTMPKLIIKAGNDEFFMLDDIHFFFDDLPGVKYNLILQNAMHVMVGHYDRLVREIGTFFLHVHDNVPFPTLDYTIESNEETAVTTISLEEEPYNITVWYAHTNNEDDRRDWRWLILGENGTEVQQGIRYYTGEIEDLGDLNFRAQFDAPESGWTGFFITVLFESPIDGRFIEFSTEPNVVPSSFGYPDCSGEECEGVLK
jgi:PhoPQ-activated pathogenicity-related protein